MKLNSFLIILFILLKQISAQCYEPIDLFGNKIKEVDCGEWITENNIISDSNKLIEGNETMFQVIFTCLLKNQVSLCNKAQKSFDNAGKIISDTIKLKEKIVVNATFHDFCEGKSDLSCPKEIFEVIGGTKSNRFYSLLDDDGLARVYPQALVKQFEFTEHPKYNDFDISARFNSRVPFHFSDDIAPINEPQYDFEYIITHELIHGLGFAGTWKPFGDPPIGLLPVVSSDSVEQPPNNIEKITFIESVFDKFIIRLDNGTSTSEYAKQINKYISDNINITTSEFEQSYQFQLAKEMLRLATTPNSLGFLPHDSTDAVILETSIEPYNPGSSLYHVSLLTYNNTSDFLMMFRANDGKTLQDLVSIGGNYSGGVIGPKIKSILETIGYATENYQNPHKPQPFAKPQPESTATSNSAFHVSAVCSQFYVIIFVIVILIHDR